MVTCCSVGRSPLAQQCKVTAIMYLTMAISELFTLSAQGAAVLNLLSPCNGLN